MTFATTTDRISSSVNGSASELERVDVVVIGAGQAGLAMGYHLARQGVGFVVIDAHDRVGDAWRSRWDSLTLFTPAKLSGLPGMRFPARPFHYPNKDEVADYLESYAEVMNLPLRMGTTARCVRRNGTGRWLVETDGASLLARNVVIATGGYQRPNIPNWASDLDPAILQLHSMDYRNPSQFQAGPVLVVGASHSGAEIAVEAAREHPTMLVGRDPGQVPIRSGGRLDPLVTPLIWFAVSHVLTVDTPMGRKVRPHVRAHGFPLERTRRGDIAAAGVERITARAAGVRDGKLMLADGRTPDVRNVVWCTGFSGDYAWIEGLTHDDDGYPDQDHGVAAKAPGLYFVGLKFQRAGASSLIGGVGRDAQQVVDHIADRVRQSA